MKTKYPPNSSRICSQCKLKKKITEYYKVSRYNHYRSICKSCYAANRVKFNKNNPERHKAQVKALYQKHKEKIKIKRRQYKKEVIHAYGDVCACCGENKIEFLSIDHSFNDGAKHRKEIGSGHQVYLFLIKNKFPSDLGLRVLCMNCNTSLGLYGYCPHEQNIK